MTITIALLKSEKEAEMNFYCEIIIIHMYILICIFIRLYIFFNRIECVYQLSPMTRERAGDTECLTCESF